MSTDPTQPMSPSAPVGSDWPKQEEPRERDGARPEAKGVDQTAVDQAAAGPDPARSSAVPPTRAQPAAPEVAPTRAQPTFQPARPTFQPAQPPRPAFHPAEPAQSAPPVEPARPPFEAAGWPEQPGRNAYPGAPAPRRRRRRRRWLMTLFALIVLLILLTISDRVALAVAENQFANQAVSSGMPVKPSVTIEGFPFLTQLIARDFHRVDISASNVPAGPVDITSVKATLTGMHLNSSFNGATVDHINATAFVSFSALAGVGGVGGLTMTADGPDKVKISAGIGPLSDTEYAKISQTGPQTISFQVLPSGSALSGLLNSFGSFSFTIPKLPATVHITRLSVTPQGLILTATADHATLTKPSS
jgi:hypothetical protein